jgi:hypothetical protein
MWILFLLQAVLFIIILEYIYRAGHFTSFWAALPFIAIPIILLQFSLYEGFGRAQSLWIGGAFLGAATLCARIFNTYMLGEPLDMRVAVSFGFMLIANIALLDYWWA